MPGAMRMRDAPTLAAPRCASSTLIEAKIEAEQILANDAQTEQHQGKTPIIRASGRSGLKVRQKSPMPAAIDASGRIRRHAGRSGKSVGRAR